MGQYYKCVNLDDNIALSPWDFDHGAKLLEHSYAGTAIVNAALGLLAADWYGRRIVWAGDYADDEHCYRARNPDSSANLYSRTTRHMTPHAARPTTAPRYLLNLDKHIAVDLCGLPIRYDGATLHALPLLTADGNGRGGGDFRTDDARVGTWARDRLGADAALPAGFKLVDGVFTEQPPAHRTACVCGGHAFQVTRLENNFGDLVDGVLEISGDMSDVANQVTSWYSVVCNDCAAVYAPDDFMIR